MSSTYEARDIPAPPPLSPEQEALLAQVLIQFLNETNEESVNLEYFHRKFACLTPRWREVLVKLVQEGRIKTDVYMSNTGRVTNKYKLNKSEATKEAVA